jgi:hypothetical protein
MELEAPPRQTIERAAAAPVERQEAARFAGGCAGDLVTLDDDRPRAASACKIGDRGADRAAAADHMRLRELIPRLCQAWLRGSRAALIELRGRVIVGDRAACGAPSARLASRGGPCLP